VPAPVSVIIPTLDEEQRIAATIDAAFAAGAAEVIVSDGGSSDATMAIARQCGAHVVCGEAMRSRQLNRGAAKASHEYLIFVHADTLLPANAAALVIRALDDDILFGGFRLRFAEDAFELRVAAAMINMRTFFTRAPWGDQAQFIRTDTFLHAGGFREIAIMEDYELAARMKRSGKTIVLRDKVTTSGRRFLQKGILRTAAINWSIITRYRLGADTDALAALYRR
jgi:rSAM/selenodomain-associated transferase 2